MTDRDKEVLEFLGVVGIATTQQIKDYIFADVSKTVVSRRLNTLVDYEYIKRARLQELNNAYVYYVSKKPKNLVHELIGTQLYVQLETIGYNVVRFLRSKRIGNLISDILVLIEDPDGYEELLFVEVQRGFNPIFKCTDKYKDLYYTKSWQVISDEFPRLLVITDLKQNPRYKEFEVLKTNTNCDNLKQILSNSRG